jgi:hypothetical protein
LPVLPATSRTSCGKAAAARRSGTIARPIAPSRTRASRRRCPRRGRRGRGPRRPSWSASATSPCRPLADLERGGGPARRRGVAAAARHVQVLVARRAQVCRRPGRRDGCRARPPRRRRAGWCTRAAGYAE